MPTNFEPKRLKPKVDIVEKPENRVQRLTNSNGNPTVIKPQFTFYNAKIHWTTASSKLTITSGADNES